MKIRINDRTYGPQQLEKCMAALSRAVEETVCISIDGSGWSATAGENAHYGNSPFQCLCMAVHQLHGLGEPDVSLVGPFPNKWWVRK